MVYKCVLSFSLSFTDQCIVNGWCGSTDDGEIKIFIYKGIQPQAIQLVGGLRPRHGGSGPVYYKVYFDRNWCMDTFYLLRDVHEDVLVCRVSLLQPSLAFYCCNLGNTCLQPYP